MTSSVPPRDWTDIHWPDIAGAEAARWIAVLPLAATEQHGPHLPLGVDTYIADAYLARARDLIPPDLPVTLLPVQRIGQSAEHVAFPGTLTPSAAQASPAKLSSWPAMILSRVDLPEPLRPKTPILAPGRKDSQMSFRTCLPPGKVLFRPFIT